MLVHAALFVSLSHTPATAPPAPDFPGGQYEGQMQFGPSEVAIDAWIEGTGPEVRATLHLPALGMMALGFAGEAGPSGELELSSSIEGSPVTLRGAVADGRWAGTWRWGGGQGPFALERTDATRPPYEEIPLEVAQGDVRLSATLLLPRGEGPFAAVVWCHGSGAIGRRSRDYVREAYVLAREGVAGVVYDKRGVGASTGNWRTSTFQDLARDAVAIRAAIGAVDRIDAERIGIGGISQGPSWIAPLACEMDPAFAFVVAISASAVTPARQHLYVVEQRMARAGHDALAIGAALELHERLDAWNRTGAGKEALEADLAAVSEEPWFSAALLPLPPVSPYPETMQQWLHVDALPIWRELDAPVFAAWGRNDALVNPERSRELLGEALGDNLSAHVFPGADHQLRLEGPPPPRPVAPGFQSALVAWALER